ncbi:MAG TPA: glucose-1-phosphate cytidylyltransferase [Syntrophorhabdaceae bacterium]|nr:glucose-1-phosphate cytidylyltransferase [Syntrophorhabdaceae bacterium]HOL05712.1 glucose-1-phosphate cytidylyltransferase [Syntrophorhabdaceae bacterium]HQE79398.1 glucose-1-phosphate cytidylyltransferase [Syntrophorhabdaceae bacterium]
MQVIILCGGLGTRLREETEFKPKPMVNIGERPILWHIMKFYSCFDYKDFVLCLGYKGEMIKEYFYNYDVFTNDFTIELGDYTGKVKIHRCNDEAGWRVTLADTGEKALKGARLKRVEKYINEDTFMMTYGDDVANVNLHALLDFHKSHGKIATVTGVNIASRFGELKIKGNIVESFIEKPEATTEFINGGFFVFNKKIFDYLRDEDECDLEIGALEQIAKEGQLMVFKHNGFWACMDTMRDVEYLNRIWKENKAPWKIW